MSAPDLYAVLGLDRSATPDQIRKAYRAMAKKVHPDNPDGGDAKKFALVKLAHDILTDDQRRHKYDATGDAEEKKIDDAQERMLQLLAQALDVALMHCARNGQDPLRFDMPEGMRNFIGGQQKKLVQERQGLLARRDMFKKIIRRFKRKKKNGAEPQEVNQLNAIIDGNLRQAEEMLGESYKADETCKRALAFLAEFDWTRDETQRIVFQQARSNFFSSTTT